MNMTPCTGISRGLHARWEVGKDEDTHVSMYCLELELTWETARPEIYPTNKKLLLMGTPNN